MTAVTPSHFRNFSTFFGGCDGVTAVTPSHFRHFIYNFFWNCGSETAITYSSHIFPNHLLTMLNSHLSPLYFLLLRKKGPISWIKCYSTNWILSKLSCTKLNSNLWPHHLGWLGYFWIWTYLSLCQGMRLVKKMKWCFKSANISAILHNLALNLSLTWYMRVYWEFSL